MPDDASSHEPFRTRIKVRSYELDSLGHLNHSAYHLYGEVARVEWFEHAGGGDGLAGAGIAPVLLETTVRFRRELRAGDVVDVTCEVAFGSGKTFAMDSEIRRIDGVLAAEVGCTIGMLDLALRKLVASPRAELAKAGLRLSEAPAKG